MSVSVVIPFFNEESNVNKLLDELIYNFNEQKITFELILVNDNSTDNTLKKLKIFEDKYKEIKIINNIQNVGQSFSLIKGIKNACFDTIITLDGDGQNNPKDIKNLLKEFSKNKDVKLVGGIRAKRKDSFIKKISSKIANKIRKYILNDNCNDTGCSLKVFSKKAFLEFPEFKGVHRFLPALFKGYGHKTMFINVDHRARIHGKSKYGTVGRLNRGLVDLFKVYLIIKRQNKK